VELFDSVNYLWFGQRNFSNWVEQDLSYNRWCHQHFHLVVSWLSCLNYLFVEQAVVCSAAAIYESECNNSMDFNPNVKIEVGWDNTQYTPKCEFIQSDEFTTLYMDSYIIIIHAIMWIHTIRWIHFIMWIHTIRWIHDIIYEFIHYIHAIIWIHTSHEFILLWEFIHYINSYIMQIHTIRWICFIIGIHIIYEFMLFCEFIHHMNSNIT
jgi:hypothetical protein